MVSSPAAGGGASAPALTRTNEPVPYVFFPVPGVEAGLTEQRRLLVAGHAGHGHLVAVQRVRPGRAQHAAARAHLGQGPLGHAEQRAQLGDPALLDDVVEERARGVGRVGDVLAA